MGPTLASIDSPGAGAGVLGIHLMGLRLQARYDYAGQDVHALVFSFGLHDAHGAWWSPIKP